MVLPTDGGSLQEVQRLPLLQRPRFQKGPHPSQRAYIRPGKQIGLKDGNWCVGSMVPYVFRNVLQPTSVFNTPDLTDDGYGFRFHYNPNQFTVQSQAGFDYYPALGDTGLPLMAAPARVQFTCLLNRSEDVLDDTPFDAPMLGCYSFAEMGTGYDIEWFFRTINGERVMQNGSDPLYESADIGLLLPSPVVVKFSKALNYAGYVESVTINHLKFAENMVPTISTMDITLARFATANLPQAAAPEGNQ